MFNVMQNRGMQNVCANLVLVHQRANKTGKNEIIHIK